MTHTSQTPPSPDDAPFNWMLVDMNSFFASVEQHDRPELRGRPVAVVPVESEYTSVIAASRDAKKRGICTGTRVSDARQLCPGIAIIKARPADYVEIHHRIIRSIDKVLPIEKVYSIDEWAIRLMGRERARERAVSLAQQIKRQLLQDFSPWLTCSIGIAPTRLLAKIACDLQKPDGLTVLQPSDLPARLEGLELQDLSGIGRNMVARLNAQGIRSVRDLWAIDKREAIRIWGSVQGGYWWAGFHGIDEPELATRHSSMSHANVLSPEFRNDAGAYGILTRLICRLGARLRYEGYVAQRLHVYLKNADDHGWSLESAVPYVQDTPTLLAQFEKLWRRRVYTHRPLHVGATVTGLVLANQVAQPLFREMEKPQDVSVAIDKINRKWGPMAVYVGSIHDFRHEMDDKIAFGRIPSVVK